MSVRINDRDDLPEIITALADGTPTRQVAKDFGIKYETLRSWWRNNREDYGGPAPAAKLSGQVPTVSLAGDGTGSATSRVFSEEEAGSLSPADLLRGWQLDPDQWEIIDGTVGVNRWQPVPDGPWNYQYKARVRRIVSEEEAADELPPVVSVDVRVRTPRVKRTATDLSVAIIYPDAQISFWRDGDETWRTTHDEAALCISRQVTAAVEAAHGIDTLVDLGDFLDATHFSRHRSAPAQIDRQGFRRAVARGQQELATRAQLAPNARRVLIPGNHDQRVILWLTDNAPFLLGFARPGDAHPVFSIEWLLETEKHGWEVAAAYPEGCHWLAPNLRAIHGWVAKGVPGASSAEYLREEVSTIFGHTPRAQTVYRTIARGEGGRTYVAHTPGGLMRVDGAVPSGTTAITIKGDPQCSRGEKWDQGLSVVFYDPEGKTVPLIEHVPIFGGRAVWHGQVFEADVDVDGNPVDRAA